MGSSSSSSSSSDPMAVDEVLVARVTAHVQAFMSRYDPSHDFSHIKRVVHLAHLIQAQTPGTCRGIVTLAALLHDVGDHKYLQPGERDEDATRMVHGALVSLGASPQLAEAVQAICLGVSYTGEVKDPARVRALVERHPELAVVQDADRLDAIGAVGIARVFAFGGAKDRTLGSSMQHLADKLVKLEGWMKTEAGREMAKARTERLRTMQEWWGLEMEGMEGNSILCD